jgi:hypothetical protein
LSDFKLRNDDAGNIKGFYDVESIMHYNAFAGAKPGKRVMMSKKKEKVDMGQRKGLTRVQYYHRIKFWHTSRLHYSDMKICISNSRWTLIR